MRRAAVRRVGGSVGLRGFVACGAALRMHATTPAPAGTAMCSGRAARKGRGNRDDMCVFAERGQKRWAPGFMPPGGQSPA